jgi:hypothetical protein
MSALLPSHVRISRAINIDASKETVLPHLDDLNNWEQWNEMVRDSSQPKAEFEKNEINSQRLKISLVSSSPDSVRTNWLSGKRSFESGFNLLANNNNTTAVQWYFDIDIKWYPWEKFSSIVLDKQMGPSMEKSLNNLKKQVSNSP